MKRTISRRTKISKRIAAMVVAATAPTLQHLNGVAFSLTPPIGPLQGGRPAIRQLSLFHSNKSGLEEGDAMQSETSSSVSYKDTDGASKGIVSALTNLVNTLSGQQQIDDQAKATISSSNSVTDSSSKDLPPTSPQELLERIRQDYVDRNYLWTGDLDLACFQKDCRFTDPTLSFEGTDTFAKNTQNLVPLVEAFVENYESRLLSIELVEKDDNNNAYVQTRWNMVGSLTASPWIFWKPKIDVLGRTKFWFRKTQKEEQQPQQPCYQVYFYDEEWEMPAYQALLQLITPAGTFASNDSSNSSDSEIR
jgi:Uncharacterized conserved protein (DUF2358)